MRPLIALLYVAILGALLFGCGAPPETTAVVSPLTISSTCLKPANDPLAKFPWEATYPLANQHVYCQHMDTETSAPSWPANTGLCTGTPGLYQIDVWVRQGGSNPDYRCTRWNVLGNGGAVAVHANYEDTMELGWLSSYPRWIGYLQQGPGTVAVVSSLQDAYTSGCPPMGGCIGSTIHQSSPATWVQIDGIMTVSSWWMGPTT
jgi:hypothetical protein